MKVKRKGIPDFYSYNSVYNRATSPLVGDIFQTESLGPVGYIEARPIFKPAYDSYSRDQKNDFVASEQLTPTVQRQRFDLAQLGEYERIMFSCLAWGEYSTYVLTGEMGSGKTSTAEFVMDALRKPRNTTCGKCGQCSGHIIISIDFNKGFTSESSAKIMRSFRILFASRLKAELRKLFRRDRLTDPFLQFSQSDENINEFSVFDDFVQECEEADNWNNQTQAGKANALFRYIEKKSHDQIDYLELLMLLVSFIKTTARQDPACFVLLLDNIDSVSPEVQFELLVEILALQEFAQIKTLVPLRRSTFERLNNHAAYSFGIVNHGGPLPVNVVKARIDYYLGVWNSLPQVHALEPAHSEALRKRLQYLSAEFKQKSSVLEKVFWLSGASIRQSLFMFERVVNNSVIQFDKNPNYRDEVLRAILCGDSPEQELSGSDRFVANIFADPSTGDFSLICIRILQFVFEFANAPNNRNIRNLFSTIRGVNRRWTASHVQKAVNYLLHTKRPLLWVDGKSRYETPAQMIDCNDRIFMTEAGGFYLKKLTCDLEYFQEAAVGVDWSKHSSLPASVNYVSLIERFGLARLCLRAVMKQDVEETEAFKAWLSRKTEFADVKILLISNRILESLGEAVLAILGSWRTRELNQLNELKSWLSIIIDGFNNEVRVVGRENKRLDILRRQYERFGQNS